MLLSRKFGRVPHMFTINLFVAQVSVQNVNIIQKLQCFVKLQAGCHGVFCLCVQLLACVGMISWNFAVKGESFLGHVLSFTLMYSSLYSTYVWPGES